MVTLRTQAEIIGHAEIAQKQLHKATCAEFLGTLMLVLASCSAAMAGGDGVAYSTGITVAMIIQALGHISGAHINPVVSLSFCLCRKTSVVRCLAFTIAQCAGSAAAAAILYGVVPSKLQDNLGINEKNPAISDVQAFGVEVMTTFALVTAIQGMTDHKKTDVYGAAPLGIGLTVTANILFGGWLSGACMNPARALGPMLLSDPDDAVWAYHWIYWAGPYTGAILATGVYQVLFRASSPPVTASTEHLVVNGHAGGRF